MLIFWLHIFILGLYKISFSMIHKPKPSYHEPALWTTHCDSSPFKMIFSWLDAPYGRGLRPLKKKKKKWPRLFFLLLFQNPEIKEKISEKKSQKFLRILRKNNLEEKVKILRLKSDLFNMINHLCISIHCHSTAHPMAWPLGCEGCWT